MDEKIEEKTLQQLFEERDKAYHILTEEIVGRIDFVFEAIIEVLSLDPAAVSWQGIDIHGVMLVIVGKIGPSETDPEKLRVLTIGIPLPIVYSKNKDLIVKFLQKHAKEDMPEPEEDRSVAITTGAGSIEDKSATRPVSMLSGESAVEYMKRNDTSKRTLH